MKIHLIPFKSLYTLANLDILLRRIPTMIARSMKMSWSQSQMRLEQWTMIARISHKMVDIRKYMHGLDVVAHTMNNYVWHLVE